MRYFPVMVLCCLLVLAGGARAQEDSAAKFRLTVNQIVVPVVVTDAKGHRVTGLKAEDFEVLEDGALRKILSFSMGGEAVTPATALYPAADSAPAATPITLGTAISLPADTAATRRTYAICVDIHVAAPHSL
jgi:hypothetical protein